jgi:hypothetical protein
VLRVRRLETAQINPAEIEEQGTLIAPPPSAYLAGDGHV